MLIAGAVNMNNHPRTRGVYPTPPSITVGTSTTPSGYVRSFAPNAAGAPFAISGGQLIANSDSFRIVSVTASSTRDGLVWRVGTYLDGDGISFELDSVTTGGYRFLVDGQYVSMSGTTSSSGGYRHFTLEFPTRTRRFVQVEGTLNLRIRSVKCKETDNLIKPPEADGLCVAWLGDSNEMMYGAYPLKGDSMAQVAADALGVSRLCLSSIADTGLVASNGGNNYLTRVSDVTDMPCHAALVHMSINDVRYGYSSADVKTNATALINAIRAVKPNIPILFLGITTAENHPYTPSPAMARAHEDAVAEAVAEANLPLVAFRRIMTDPDLPAYWADTTTTAGNLLIYTDGSHSNIPGNAYIGEILARSIYSLVVETAKTAAPMPLPKSAASPKSGLLIEDGGALGYGSGSGGSVTQTTSKTTAVTLNTRSGRITMAANALAAGASVVFTVNNSLVTGTSIVMAHGATSLINTANYRVEVVVVTSGSFNLCVTNTSAGSLSQAVPLNFAVLGMSTS